MDEGPHTPAETGADAAGADRAHLACRGRERNRLGHLVAQQYLGVTLRFRCEHRKGRGIGGAECGERFGNACVLADEVIQTTLECTERRV